LQVAALRGGAEARELAASLATKGYPAFVVHPVPEAPVAIYWVRVGPYADRASADQMGSRLETEERFKPWVIQP
jgi:cell division septation protein DedD